MWIFFCFCKRQWFIYFEAKKENVMAPEEMLTKLSGVVLYEFGALSQAQGCGICGKVSRIILSSFVCSSKKYGIQNVWVISRDNLLPAFLAKNDLEN